MFLLHFAHSATEAVKGLEPTLSAVAALRGDDDTRDALIRELTQPTQLPEGEGSVFRVDLAKDLAVEWRENEWQEKVSRYHYCYLRTAGIALWPLSFAGAPIAERDVFAWAGTARWDARSRLAPALARHGYEDKSDEALLPWVMTNEPEATKRSFLATYPGRALGAGWIGGRYLSDDFHFPRHIECAWRADGNRIEHRFSYARLRDELTAAERVALDGYFGAPSTPPWDPDDGAPDDHNRFK